MTDIGNNPLNEGCVPLIIQFIDQSTFNGNPLAYQSVANGDSFDSHRWCLGSTSSTISTVQNPVFGFFDPGVYTIKLIVTGNGSDYDTTYQVLTVNSRQDIVMNIGWNMISSRIIASQPDMLDIISDISHHVAIIKNSSGQTTIPSLSINGIGDWVVCEGYKVKALNDTVLSLCGEKVNATMACNIDSGWNIISYFPDTPMSINQALSSISSNIIIAKNANGKIWIPSLSINNIGSMFPGQGYKIKMNSQATLVYPGN